MVYWKISNINYYLWTKKYHFFFLPLKKTFNVLRSIRKQFFCWDFCYHKRYKSKHSVIQSGGYRIWAVGVKSIYCIQFGGWIHFQREVEIFDVGNFNESFVGIISKRQFFRLDKAAELTFTSHFFGEKV